MTKEEKRNSFPKRQRILPARVISGEMALAKYILIPFGLVSDSVGDITIDNKIALIQPHPESDLYLCPLRPNPQPDISTAWFYADCIAYDHDIPVIVSPTAADVRKFGFRYIYYGTGESYGIAYENFDTGEKSTIHRKRLPPQKLTGLYFNDQLFNILSAIREFHHGPLTYIFFRHDGWNGGRDLSYTSLYSSSSQEIHLYAAALRQADTLTEYLFYHRVIESATNSNGKAWISFALPKLRNHLFDDIKIGMVDEWSSRSLLKIYRRRALRRLSVLLKLHHSKEKVADYLYTVNRCGIAHGRKIVRADITPSYFEMVRDTYILKLLARIAIDEKLGNSRL